MGQLTHWISGVSKNRELNTWANVWHFFFYTNQKNFHEGKKWVLNSKSISPECHIYIYIFFTLYIHYNPSESVILDHSIDNMIHFSLNTPILATQ